jgi:hypothetical protein
MATAQGPHPTPEAQESMFYERCWRCRAVVPNGLVRRRKMKTGLSTGSHVGTGAAYTRLDHYEVVSLCGVCDDELTTAERQQDDASFRRWSWVGRAVGITFGTALLTRIGIPLGASLSIMLTLAYFRIIGRAFLTMFVTTNLAVLIGYPPQKYPTPVMLSWAVIWPGFIVWQLWYPENRPWPFRKVLNVGLAHTVHQRKSAPNASLSDGGDAA